MADVAKRLPYCNRLRSANGLDVRTVLHDLLAKRTKLRDRTERSYSLLSVAGQGGLDEALAIICHLAKLKAEKQNASTTFPRRRRRDPANPIPVTKANSKDPSPTPQDAPPPLRKTTLKTKHVTVRWPRPTSGRYSRRCEASGVRLL